MRAERLDSLTGLRFVAAMAIAIHHLPGRIWLQPEWIDGLGLGHAVSVFFVLSGFILAYQYPKLDGWPERVAFWWARAARIFPAHLVTLLASLVLIGYAGDPIRLIANALLLQSWVPDGTFYFSYNAVSWSISTELAFYLLFPLLIVVPRAWPIALVAAFLVSYGVVRMGDAMQFPPFAPGGKRVVNAAHCHGEPACSHL